MKVARLECDVKNRARDFVFIYCVYVNMSSSDNTSCSFSDNTDSNDKVYSCQFRPYEDEHLVHEGEDVMSENNEETERDLDGLTPVVLEDRFDRKVKFDYW